MARRWARSGAETKSVMWAMKGSKERILTFEMSIVLGAGGLDTTGCCDTFGEIGE
jgi:hypothetical protein